MKLLLAGGGTGGHVNPAIAIAEAMKKRHVGLECAFVGRCGGEENRAITSRGYKLYTLNIRGLQRKFSKETLKSLFLAARSLSEAKKILRDFSPDVTVATGGYVCWPIVKESIRLGIPTLMHESNIYPGLVTRMLGGKCDTLLLNSEKSLAFLKETKNSKIVGNPLREDFFKSSRKQARSKLGIKDGEFFIVSFGGSLGSEKINEVIISVMKNYTSKTSSVKHLHSAGTRYFKTISEEHKDLISGTCGCFVKPYIDNMPTALLAADLVICRSGAMTVSEIACCGKAAILIPSPNVADDHQRKNAEVLNKANAAIMIKENELSSALLENKIFDIATDKNLRKSLENNIKKFHVSNTSELICKEIDKKIISATK